MVIKFELRFVHELLAVVFPDFGRAISFRKRTSAYTAELIHFYPFLLYAQTCFNHFYYMPSMFKSFLLYAQRCFNPFYYMFNHVLTIFIICLACLNLYYYMSSML